jgi:hypothetical protein
MLNRSLFLDYSFDSYIFNIEKVDKGVKSMVNLINSYYGDNATSFVFTADHGMSDKGIHDAFLVID